MELARAASNHQYLPSSGSSESAANNSNNGAPSPPPEEPTTSTATPSTRGKRAPASRGGRRTGKVQKRDGDVDVQSNSAVAVDRNETLPSQDAPTDVTADEAAAVTAAAAAAWARDRHQGTSGENNQFAVDAGAGAEQPHQGNQGDPEDPFQAAADSLPMGSSSEGHPAPPDLPQHSQHAGLGGEEDQGDPLNDGEGSPGGQRGGNSRVLSTTKRAAQNRASQRAFRERRDRHIKELETKAAQFDTVNALFNDLRDRYAQMLGIMDALRRENEALRLAQGLPIEASILPSEEQQQQQQEGPPGTEQDQQQSQGNGNEGTGAAENGTATANAAAAAAAAIKEGERGLDVVASAAAEAARLASATTSNDQGGEGDLHRDERGADEEAEALAAASAATGSSSEGPPAAPLPAPAPPLGGGEEENGAVAAPAAVPKVKGKRGKGGGGGGAAGGAGTTTAAAS